MLTCTYYPDYGKPYKFFAETKREAQVHVRERFHKVAGSLWIHELVLVRCACCRDDFYERADMYEPYCPSCLVLEKEQ